MAQIIKQRRGSITQLKDVTARVSELVVATGSIGNLNGPFLFVGETEGIAGAYRPISKIYQGASAPTIAVGSYGSVMDGTPFYASGNKSLYILSQAGNSKIDLTGNIEGNTISGVTINSLTGSNADITSITGSISGSNGKFLNLTGVTFTSTNSNITALTGSNAYVGTLTGGTLTVTGTTNLNGDLLISGNIIQTGSIDLTGNVRIGGNITVGDATSDFVSFGAEISSSIVPDIHNAFDLGSSEKNWRNLHISGTAYINTLEANQVNFTDLGVLEDLTVSGSTFLGNGGDITVISGSVYNDQLTEKRMVVVGSQGLLTNYSGLTFDNGNLNLSGALEVTNIQGTGSLYLKPDLDDSRLFEIYNSAGPSGYTDIHFVGNADLNFFGDDTNYLKIDDYAQTATLVGVNGVFVSSSLNVTGSSTLNSTLEVKGATGLNSTLDVTGSATLKSTLQVDSTSQLKGAVGMNSSLDVTGSATLKSTLQVNSTSELRGAVGMNSTLDVTGSAQFKSTINVDSEATLASATVEDLTQDRIVTVGAGGSLIDSSGFTYNGTVFKIGNGQFEVDTNDGDVRTSGSLTTNGLTNNGNLTVNGVLTVTGNTQLQANLYVSGNLEVLGSSTNVIIQSQTVEIDDNIIRMNAYSPFLRYAGFEVMDSGSSGISSSVLWDSQNDYWLLTNQNNSGSKFVGTTFGEQGSEVSLTSGTIPKATSANTIGDSLLTENGTTLSYNTNKFQVTASDGATLIAGNVTVSAGGGADAGTKTSQVVFRNSSNVLGYVSATESTDVLDGILGYKNADGALKFSTVIDGGTYS
jgi:cytoskeletal protein CcmA (bactofilin family)